VDARIGTLTDSPFTTVWLGGLQSTEPRLLPMGSGRSHRQPAGCCRRQRQSPTVVGLSLAGGGPTGVISIRFPDCVVSSNHELSSVFSMSSRRRETGCANAVKGQPRPQSVFRILPDWGIRTEKSGIQHYVGVPRATMWLERHHRLLQLTALSGRI